MNNINAFSLEDVRDIISEVLSEERQTQETEKELHDAEIRIFVSRNINISEILTGIRILQGIAVVTQVEPSIKTKGGDSMIHLMVRWVPNPGSQIEWVNSLGNLIKTVRGVKVVRIVSVDGGEVAIGDTRRPALY